MSFGHNVGVALGALATAIAAFLALDPNVPQAQAVLAFTAACSAASVYLQRYYEPGPPQQAPP